jgi:hypothetical protein
MKQPFGGVLYVTDSVKEADSGIGRTRRSTFCIVPSSLPLARVSFLGDGLPKLRRRAENENGPSNFSDGPP